MSDRLFGSLIIFLAFGMFSTLITRIFRLASEYKGSWITDVTFGFGTVIAVGILIAASVYGIMVIDG